VSDISAFWLIAFIILIGILVVAQYERGRAAITTLTSPQACARVASDAGLANRIGQATGGSALG
jgi:hypothetical protein